MSLNFVSKSLKRLFDISGALGLLTITIPVTIPTAMAIRMSMGNPIFFCQERPGKDGKPFKLIKFRTMRAPKPEEDPISSDASRVTRLGQFLRSTSLDEFPTFINVLKGEMSFVGPRPLLMQYLERYTPEQLRRHDVKPGITGLAAVMGRNQLTWEEKFRYDVEYVDKQSLSLDAWILWRTFALVLKREGISAEGHVTMPEYMGPTTKDALV